MSAYQVWMSLGALAAVTVSFALLRRAGTALRTSVLLVAAALLGALLGAWGLGSLLHPSLAEVGARAYGLDGALLLGAAGVTIASPALRVSALGALDSIAPGAGIGIALARIGCLQAGCCFGRPTDVPWAVACDSGGAAHLLQIAAGSSTPFERPLPLHPTQAYEAIAAFFGAAIAIWALRRRAPLGAAAFGFASWIGLFRAVNAAFREPDASAAVAPLWFTALLTLGGFVGLVTALRARRV